MHGDRIEGVDNELQLIMQSFFDSILDVSDKYLFWKIKKKNVEKENIVYVERAFAYELYFQWNMNTTIYGIPMYKLRDKFLINSEIKKEFVEKICDKYEFSYPDMLLHGDNSSDENYLVCEIKRKETIDDNKESLTKDIDKLGFFLRDDLHTIYEDINWKGYKIGIFVLTGQYWGGGNAEVKPDDITNNIQLEKLEVNEDMYKRIICVVYNGKKLKYDSLGNVIEEKKSNKTNNNK